MVVFFVAVLGGAAAWIWREPLVEFLRGVAPDEAKNVIEQIVPPEPVPEPVPVRSPDQPPLLDEDARAALGREWTSPKDGQTYVWIPQTWYLMGCTSLDEQCEPDEKPAHTAGTSGFWLATHEVRVSAWRAYLEATMPDTVFPGSDAVTANLVDDLALGRQKKGVSWEAPLDPKVSAEPDWPVTQVTWDDAAGYCGWIGGRLPTEAEWEMASREREKRTIYPWGDDESPASVVENLGDVEMVRALRVNRRQRSAFLTGYDDDTVAYAAVDAFPSNALGIAGLAGNVREWVADFYGEGWYAESPEEDPAGPETGELRVVRGGSWASPAVDLRVSNRQALPPDTRSPVVGFRCAFDE